MREGGRFACWDIDGDGFVGEHDTAQMARGAGRTFHPTGVLWPTVFGIPIRHRIGTMMAVIAFARVMRHRVTVVLTRRRNTRLN